MNGTVVEVLKWIGIVFAAGFVGYFGRHLAAALIERLRRKKAAQLPEADTPPAGTRRPEEAAVATQAKVEKKRTKAEVKRGKKGPRR